MQSTRALAWGAQVTPAFRRRLYQLVSNLGWKEAQASELMAVMAFETGRTFSPSVSNPLSSATGLIQFMAATARGLGTSTQALARMSAVEQLDWVEKYFRPNAARIHTLEDLYMAVLWPRGIGKLLEYSLWKTGTRAYAVNKGLDANRDGRVTKREAAAAVRRQLKDGLQPGNVWLPHPLPEVAEPPTPDAPAAAEERADDPFGDPAAFDPFSEYGPFEPRPPGPISTTDFNLWLGNHW
jgi:hypothetical protein